MAAEDYDVPAGFAESPLVFECPRCGSESAERFYGPCGGCRGALLASQGSDGRDDVEADEFVPKMNVTPNAVALKDD